MNSNAYLCIKKNMATMMTLKSYIAAMLFLAIIAVPELKAQRIVVLGSSTAAGAGVSSPDKAWASRVSAWLADNHPGSTLINLAKGGYTTCRIMPSGTPCYQAREHLLCVDTLRNIDKALSLHPDILIINMPTNDTSHGISVKTQMKHFKIITDKARKAGVEVFITTSQPHNFGEQYRPPYTACNAPDASKQHYRNWFGELSRKIKYRYGSHAIDFYTNIATPDGLGFISLAYDSGDGVHLNDAAHYIFARRVIDKLIILYKTKNL